jgi:hypothetical protein
MGSAQRNLGHRCFLPCVPRTRFSPETQAWEVILDKEPAAAGSDVTLEISERRQQLRRQNRAFIERLTAAIEAGLETPAGVLGYKYGPRRIRRS